MVKRSALIIVGYFILHTFKRRFTLKKSVILGILVLTLFLLLSSASAHNTDSNDLIATKRFASNLSLTIDYGNTSQIEYTNLTATTAFELLELTATVTYTQFVYGKFIDSINGIANNANGNGFYWQYWVNAELAPIAADNYVLSEGDYVLWKYCAPENTTPSPPTVNPELILGLGIIGAIGAVIILSATLAYFKLR